MRAAEYALNPVGLSHAVAASQLGIGIVPEHRHDGVALVEDHHAAVQVRHGNVVALYRNGGRHAQPADDFIDVFALEAVVK